MKRAMKLSQKRMGLIKKLDIGALIVTEMMQFYALAINAKTLGISAPDPVIFKEEALKNAKMFGDCYIHGYNSSLIGL